MAGWPKHKPSFSPEFMSIFIRISTREMSVLCTKYHGDLCVQNTTSTLCLLPWTVWCISLYHIRLGLKSHWFTLYLLRAGDRGGLGERLSQATCWREALYNIFPTYLIRNRGSKTISVLSGLKVSVIASTWRFLWWRRRRYGHDTIHFFWCLFLTGWHKDI